MHLSVSTIMWKACVSADWKSNWTDQHFIDRKLFNDYASNTLIMVMVVYNNNENNEGSIAPLTAADSQILMHRRRSQIFKY